MDYKQAVELRLKKHTKTGKADVMTSEEFGSFYGVTPEVAARKLKAAKVEKVSSKWFIPSIVDKCYQQIL